MEGLAESLHRLGTETAFEVLARAKALEATGRRVIHLEIGEPDFTTPGHIIEAAARALRDGETHYCPAPGIPALREACAEHLSRHRGLAIDPAACGRDPGCEAVPLLRPAGDVRPRRRGHLPEPRLPHLRVGHPLLRRNAGGAAARRGARVHLHGRGPGGAADAAHEDGDPQLARQPHRRHRRAGAQRSRSPRLLADHYCWILSDEVYSEMLYDAEHDTIASHEGLLERTILLDGFSKTFAMTGWRLGYAALPEAARRADRPPADQLGLLHAACLPARGCRRADRTPRRGRGDAGGVPAAARRSSWRG